MREYQIYQVDYDVTVQYDSANATIQYKQDCNYIIFDLVDGKAVLEGDRSELLNDLPFKNNEDRISLLCLQSTMRKAIPQSQLPIPQKYIIIRCGHQILYWMSLKLSTIHL